MTNKQIFTAAHKLAKKYTGDYSARLSLALKNVYAGLRKKEYKKVSNFTLTTEAQEENMKLNRSEIFAKYGFEAILVGKKTTLGHATMSIKFVFGGFKHFFQSRESFSNWMAKVGVIPARYINGFTKRTNDAYIVDLNPVY